MFAPPRESPRRGGPSPRGRQPAPRPRGGGEPVAAADRRGAGFHRGGGSAAAPAAELRRSASL